MRAALLVVLVACSSKVEEQPPSVANPPSMPPAPKGDTTASAHAPPCDALLPAALRDRYFPGATIDSRKLGRCNIALANGTSARLAVLCNVVAPLADALKKQMPGMTELPDVGQRALIFDGGSFHQVTAWDADSPCQLTLNTPKAIDVAALARDVLALLPAK